MKKLNTIDADTLQAIAYEPISFLVEDLLPQGLHLLAGAPKIGKSWLALWLCLRVAQGEPLWNFPTHSCEVLYLCLEDSFQRIQSRLFDLTEDAPPTLHFAVMAEQLHSGLVEQIEQFLKEHPATGLIVIDTLQRIRTMSNDANPYANDYRDIGVLKALADRHHIAVLLKKIDPAGMEGLTPNSFSHQIRKSVDALRHSGISVSFRKSNGERLICLHRADGVDDPAAAKSVPIDPVGAATAPLRGSPA